MADGRVVEAEAAQMIKPEGAEEDDHSENGFCQKRLGQGLWGDSWTRHERARRKINALY